VPFSTDLNLFTLKLLGGASLEGPAGRMRGRPAHTRRVALLTVLAMSRGRMVGRERLIALLWPEASSESGRALLSESLYVLRKALGEEAILTAGDEVGINDAIVEADAAVFEAFLARDAFVDAVGLYRGPFLNGFYVTDAPDFERWAEDERSRLARAYTRALEALAAVSEEEGDLLAAAEWWRALLVEDPYNSRAVLRAMAALEAVGERAAALQLAETHGDRMRDELAAAPDPQVVDLAERLRTAPLPSTVVVPVHETPPGRDSAQIAGDQPNYRSALGSGGQTGEETTPARVPDPLGVDPLEGAVPRRKASWPLPRWGHIAAAAALVLLLGLGANALSKGNSEPTGEVSVLVLPFYSGSSTPVRTEETAALHADLTSSLEAVPRVRATDGSGVFADGTTWRRVPLRTVLRRARGAGAEYVLLPDYVEGPPRRVAVALYATRTGERVFHGTGGVDGEPAGAAVQRIAVDAVRAIAARDSLRLRDVRYLLAATASPVALGELLEGERQFRAGDVAGAVAAARRAIAADSSFGLAYHRLSVLETWDPRWDYPAAYDVVEAGLARSEELHPLWTRLLEAQRRYLARDCSGAAEAFQRLTVDDGDLIDGWFGLGETLFHCSAQLGLAPEAALPAFEHVVAMDSTFSPVYEHLTELSLRMGDERRARLYSAHVRDPDESPSYRIAVALRFGNRQEQRKAFSEMRRLDRKTLSALVRMLHQDRALLDSIGTILMGPSRTAFDRRQGSRYRFLALAAAGRWPEARAIWTAGGAEEFDKWMVEAFLAGAPVADLAEPMLARAHANLVQGAEPDFTTIAAATKDPFRALVHRAVLLGDSAEVLFLLRKVEHAAARAHPSDPEPPGLASVLNARLALLAGDTARAVTALETGLRRGPWWISPFAPLAHAGPERFLLARLLIAHGDGAGAQRWLRSFGGTGSLGDLLYTAEVSRLEAVAGR
jgi:DNA-binding SARP family transcriptional activator